MSGFEQISEPPRETRIQNIVWTLGGLYHGVTWHKHFNNGKCTKDSNWNPMDRAAFMQATGQMRSDASVLCVDTEIRIEPRLIGQVGTFSLSKGVLYVKT